MEAGVEATGEAFARLLIALLGGSLIGLERERARAGPSHKQDIPGIRSFGLIGLYGGIVGLAASGLLSGLASSGLLVSLAFAGFLVLYAAYTVARYVIHGVQGVTTNVVMLITFMLGLLAGAGYLIEAASISVMVALLLALKEPIERLVPAITYREFLALLEVGVLALVVAPLVRAYGRPVLGIDPYKVYLFFLVVLALSFVSYAAARVMGVRGLVYSALLGGLVSSEAAVSGVTRLLAGLKAPGGEARRLLRSATATIVGAMQARAMFIVAAALYIFSGPEGLQRYAAVVAPLALGSVSVAWMGLRLSPRLEASFEAVSPLSWGSAVRAAAAYLLLTMAVGGASSLGAGAAAPAIAALGGLVNATAAILSVASLAGQIGLDTAVAAMMAAVSAATLAKPVYADPSLTRDSVNDLVVLCSVLSVPPAAAAVAVYL